MRKWKKQTEIKASEFVKKIVNDDEVTIHGDGSQIRILANRNDDGKKGALRKAIDAEYDDMKYGFAFGDTETETAVVKFTQQMQSQFNLNENLIWELGKEK